MATGRKNSLTIEVYGSAGALAFDLERLNELSVCTDPAAGFTRMLVTEAEQPYVGAWWPPGHILGWDHTFTSQAADFLTAIASGDEPSPSFADGLAVQRVLAAIEESGARSGQTIDLPIELEVILMSAPYTLFTGQWADLTLGRGRRAGGRLGLRRARDRGLRGAPRRVAVGRRGLHRRASRDPRQARARPLGDLQPPDRAGRLRRPDRLPAPGDRAAAGVGRRRRRGRAAAGGRGDAAHRAAGPRARREDGRRLHRVVDLAVRRDVPARGRRPDRGGLPGLRRPLEPDPRRLRRVRRAVRARGASLRDRLRLLVDAARAGRDRATARRSGSTGTRAT